ncbi:MAG TPA: orotidine-5'-phosphate decarboxylase [Acidobacteriota bacterium]|nr:orotidine-5'-phosphate decarboxylase [Acidobacteriota bacterium]
MSPDRNAAPSLDRLIVALDVESGSHALELAEKIRPVTRFFKIGSHLFTLEGPALVAQLVERDCSVFLDLKFHDIPQVVAAAVRSAARLGVSMLTLHAAGGLEMLYAAVGALDEFLETRSPLLLGVTVLTSFSPDEWKRLFPNDSIDEAAQRLAALCQTAGLKGLVCSPHELDKLTDVPLKKVVPGIRPAGSNPDDQQRTMTPAQAITAGADYLVVGRPITRAANPEEAAGRIRREIEGSRR